MNLARSLLTSGKVESINSSFVDEANSRIRSAIYANPQLRVCLLENRVCLQIEAGIPLFATF